MNKDVNKRSSKSTRQKNHRMPDRFRRDHHVEVRFSDMELARLDEQCKERGLNRSSLLRGKVDELEKQTVRKEVIHRDANMERLCSEMRKADINLNQVARALNTQARFRRYVGYERVSNAEIADKFAKLRAAYDALRESVDDLYRWERDTNCGMLTADEWKVEADCWRREAERWKVEADSWRLEAGDAYVDD